MAGRKSTSTDFEDRYFDLVNARSDRQDSKLEKILEQVMYTNGRVTKLEGEVKDIKTATSEPPAKKDLPSVLRDPKFIQAMLYFSLATVLIAAYLTKFDVSRLLG